MARILFLLLVLLSIGVHSVAQLDTVRIDSIVTHAVTTDTFEGTVLVADQGEVVYHQSFGFRDLESSLPVENSTRFVIASVTKMITAIVILQLVEEQKLALEDPLSVVLPDYAIPNADSITVHHLLLHTSGLPNEDFGIYSRRTLPDAFVRETLLQPSNEFNRFNYANLDYVLLGLIIERYDQQSWSESVQSRILDKLSMTQTGFLMRNVYPENFACTFSYDAEGNRVADPILYLENYYAAAGMYSTARDLLTLDQALNGNELLSESSKERMFTSYPEFNYSGYGVWVYTYPFSPTYPKLMERRGGILGANVVMVRMLERNRTILILSNTNRFNPDTFGNQSSLKEALIIGVSR